MGTTRTIKINRFDRGAQTAMRSRLEGGASLVKHFNIYDDYRMLKPVPSYEDFTTVAERALNIKALGSSGETLYGVGKAITNWHSAEWAYRTRINYNTALSTGSTTWFIMRLDLVTSLPAGFWTHTNSDGSDIRLTNLSNVELDFYIAKFDQANSVATIFVNATIQDMYIYYGNATASSVSNPGNISNVDIFIPLDDIGTVYSNGSASSDVLDGAVPSYTDGLISRAVQNYVRTDNADSVGYGTGDDIHVTMLFKYVSPSTSSARLLDFAGGEFSLFVPSTTNKLLRVSLQTVGASTTTNAVTPLVPGTWYYLDFTYDEDNAPARTNLYINGVSDATTNTGSGNIDLSSGYSLYLCQNPDFQVDYVTINFSDESAATILTRYKSATDGTFWTGNTEELFTDITPIYDGFQIYYKPFDASADWREYLIQNSTPARDLNKYATDTFLEVDDSFSTITADSENWYDRVGFLYYAYASSANLNINNTPLTVFNATSIPLTTFAVDKVLYYNLNDSINDIIGTTSTQDVFVPYSNPISHCTYQYYLAMGGTRRNRANIEIWDMINDDPIEFIDAGYGKLRNLVNINGSLYAIVCTFVDNPEQSNGQPTIDIRQWQQGYKTKTTHRYEVENVDVSANKAWEQVVDNRHVEYGSAFVFYVNPESELTGMWALGYNDFSNEVGLSILFDTATLGDINNYYSIGKNIFFIHANDGRISKLAADTYNIESRYESLILDDFNPGEVKAIRGIEVAFNDKLPTGQIVKLYWKNIGETTWTLINTLTGDGTKKLYEFNAKDDGKAYPEFTEGQVALTSQYGPVAATDINVEVEYSSTLVQ